MNLIGKIKVLSIICLHKLGLLKLIYVAKRIPLNEYSKELLNQADLRKVDGIRFKLAIDPSGEYRFYLPDYDKENVYRINPHYSLKQKTLPLELEIIHDKIGRCVDGN